MTTPELERVLDTLLHDVRTPLGVASGYVRLLRQGRISDPAEIDRLLAKTQDALRAMSTLCADVSAWRDLEPITRAHDIPVETFTSSIAARLTESGMTIHRASNDASVTLLDEPDAVASAVATVLSAIHVARLHRVSARMHVTDGLLRIDADDPGADAGLQPFDPWQYGGLQVPLACRTIVRAGGQWHPTVSANVAVSLTFPIADAVGDRS